MNHDELLALKPKQVCFHCTQSICYPIYPKCLLKLREALVRNRYNARHPEKMIANTRKWERENREKHLERRRKYWHENRDLMLEKKREYYQQNREEIIHKSKEYKRCKREEKRNASES